MKRLIAAASLAFGIASAGAAFASTTTDPASSPACGSTTAKVIHEPSTTTETTMAGTSSDMGNAGSGASSSSIGTGSIDKTGVNSPCAPGASGGPQTGAIPAPPTTAP